jgi:hypothetical protein
MTLPRPRIAAWAERAGRHRSGTGFRTNRVFQFPLPVAGFMLLNQEKKHHQSRSDHEE